MATKPLKTLNFNDGNDYFLSPEWGNIENKPNTIENLDSIISIQNSRIDSLSKMPDGSTTGDAEMTDARIDADGNIHTNLGENIRKNTRSIYKPFENDITPFMETDYKDNISVSKLNGVYHIETSYTDGQHYWGASIPLNKTQQELTNRNIYVKIHNSEKLQNVNCIISNKWNAWAGSGIVTQWNAVKDNECEIVLLKEKDFGDNDLFLIVQSLTPIVPVSFDFSVYDIPNKTVPNLAAYALESKHSSSADCLKSTNQDGCITFEDVMDYMSSDYIICWGDSLTSQGGWTDRLAQLSGRVVHNAGTGGENTNTIMARQGADVMLINNITIPANTTPVIIATYSTGIGTEFNKIAKPLLQGGSNHINPVTIGDIQGTLTWTGSNYNDTSGNWTFTRSEPGSEVVIDRPTPILTAYDRLYNNPHLMIIFMGQNGGYDDIQDLVNKHKLMIEHSNARHVIVLGLSSGTASSRADYESEMQKTFGRYFISLRDYLSKYGLADAGLTATDADINAMNEGEVPPQLLSDSVHYTSVCKTVIGNMIYKKCKELNIFK